MFLRKKGQSTAEYAIVIGLVIAVAAGVLQVALKGGIRKKANQALDLLDNAGVGTGEGQLSKSITASGPLYSQEYRETNVFGGTDYVDTTNLQRGGGEQKHQKQTSTTTSVSVETLDSSN